MKIIYDGECPFCSNYVLKLRLENVSEPVELVNARKSKDTREELIKNGININEGMTLVLDGHYYHGSDCIHRLALMCTKRDWFNKLNYWIFRSHGRAQMLYPVLRTGRMITLKLLRRKSLSD